MANEKIMTADLEAVAVDIRQLATNFTDVVPDCCGLGADPKTELMNRHPLYNWLINTPLSRRVRGMINSVDEGICVLHKDGNGKYVIEIPGSFWSLPYVASTDECCWQPFDFAKCESNVPVNRLCLKDCDNIDDIIMGEFQKLNRSYGEFGSRGENYVSVKERIAKLSMAFLTAYNVILGTDNNTTDMLKPFHGLLQVMSNPAISTIEGADILSAFDSLYCRLAMLGTTDVVFATNPIIYNSILSVIRVGQNGQLPLGWTRNGDEVRFHGMSFIQDRHVPVDLENATGEIWVLSGDAVGLWMAADLTNPIKRPTYAGGQFTEASAADGCGNECKWWYNYGAAFNNDANKLAIITNVPISAYCVATTGDLGALIQPKTLVPKV